MSKTVSLPLFLLSLGIFSATCTVGCGSSSPGGGTGGHSGTGGVATGSGGTGVGGHVDSGTDAGVGGASATDGGMDIRADATDVRVDSGPQDVAMDVRVDVPADVPVDVRVDVAVDVPADVPVDVPADVPAPVDVRPDVTVDVGTDVTIDTGNPDVSTMLTFQVPLIPIPGLVPPATGSGMATVLVNTVTGAVNTSGTFTGLLSAVTVGHIHDNAGVALTPFTFSGLNGALTAGGFTGTLTLTPAQITSLTTSGLWFVNIHSTNNAGGELRGFILP